MRKGSRERGRHLSPRGVGTSNAGVPPRICPHGHTKRVIVVSAAVVPSTTCPHSVHSWVQSQ